MSSSRSSPPKEAYQPWVLPQVEGELVIDLEDEEESEQLKPPTLEELEQWRNEAREDGFQQGFEQGYEQGKAAVEARAEQWQQLLDALDKPFSLLEKSLSDTVFSLSVTIAQQLVKKTLQVDPEELLDVINDCLDILAEDSQKIKVSLNPDDADWVREYYEQHNKAPAYQIIEDAAISKGGCIVQSSHSTIDATLEKRLQDQLNHIMANKQDTPEV